jgi:hypothetical protein
VTAPALALRRPAPRLRVVDLEARRRTRRVRWAVRGLAALAIAALVAAVTFHVALAQGQVQLDSLERDLAVEQQRYDELRLAVAEAAAPARIVARAVELGMVAPGGPASVLTVPPDDAPDPVDATADTLGGWEKVKPYLATAP